jgi:flagellar protein FlaG
MNTVSNIGQALAMDGHKYYNNVSAKSVSTSKEVQNTLNISDSAKVVDRIVQNMAQVKADAQQIQKLSDMVLGRKLQFNVNEELGSVVIKVVDPNTNSVIKEIPSAEIQKLKISIRKAIGLLFDEMI